MKNKILVFDDPKNIDSQVIEIINEIKEKESNEINTAVKISNKYNLFKYLLPIHSGSKFRLLRRIINKLLKIIAGKQMEYFYRMNELANKYKNKELSSSAKNEIGFNSKTKELTYKVSIIINTLNRDYWLKRVIDSLAYQTYENFEIIVVNGPSTDNTDSILEKYKDIIKVRKCDVANLSVSRNIGIKAASGDIVIFIDDDAVPMNKYWIENYVKSFEDNHDTGGIGGKVYDGNNNLQFDSGYITIWGQPVAVNSVHKPDNHDSYHNLMGTNSAFLRKALLEIGGFDEYYEYYFDETDVVFRMLNAGFKIMHHPDTTIYHEGANTYERKPRYFSNWYAIVKNQVYFGYKASEDKYSLKKRKKNILKESNIFKMKFLSWLLTKKITKEDYKNFIDMWVRGVKQGEYDGLNSSRLIKFDLESDSEFLKINKDALQEQINVCFLLPCDINENGGSAKHTKELINSLIKLNINIHVIYIGNKNRDYMQNGINYYSVTPQYFYNSKLKNYPISNRAVSLSYSLYKKLDKLNKMYNIHIIETPLWDFSGLLCTELLNIPVVTRLQTPAKIVSNIHNYKKNGDMSLFYGFEKHLLKKSNHIISISDCIKQTIENTYDISFESKIDKNYLGIEDISFNYAKKNAKNKDKIIIFFIGRLERRKGIVNLFEAIPNILKKYENIEFRIAGEDVYDPVFKSFYIDYFKKKNKKLLKNVSFLGVISDKQKEEEFENCDIFISPSHYESFGIIFIEAMRHRKPVIGCNAGGMPEIVAHGSTGLLCEPDNTPELEDVLIKLIKNKEERESMGIAGYKRFKEYFTSDKMAQGTLDIYKKVIANYKKSA